MLMSGKETVMDAVRLNGVDDEQERIERKAAGAAVWRNRNALNVNLYLLGSNKKGENRFIDLERVFRATSNDDNDDVRSPSSTKFY